MANVTSTASNYNLDSAPECSYVWYKNPAGPSIGEIVFATKGVQSFGMTQERESTIEVAWRIIRNENLVVFETEPSDSLADVWYEGSESYAIDQATGFHTLVVLGAPFYSQC